MVETGRGSGTQILVPKGHRRNVPVTIDRPTMESSFGFGFGTDKLGNKVVAVVEAGGVAEDRLEVGDLIRTVNSASLEGVSHAKALQLVCGGLSVSLLVERRFDSKGLKRRGSISKVEPNHTMMMRNDGVGESRASSTIPVAPAPPSPLDSDSLALSILAAAESEAQEEMERTQTALTKLLGTVKEVEECTGSSSDKDDDSCGKPVHDAVVDVDSGALSDSSDSNDGLSAVKRRLSLRHGQPTAAATPSGVKQKLSIKRREQPICDDSDYPDYPDYPDYLDYSGKQSDGSSPPPGVRSAGEIKVSPPSRLASLRIPPPPPVGPSGETGEATTPFRVGIPWGSTSTPHPPVEAKAGGSPETGGMASGAPTTLVYVVIEKTAADRSFGFKFGSSAVGQIVETVNPSGLASGRLEADDVITSINGTPTAGLTHSEAVQMIVAKEALQLVVQRVVGDDGQTAVRRRSNTNLESSGGSSKNDRPKTVWGRQRPATIFVQHVPEPGGPATAKTVALERESPEHSYGIGVAYREKDGTKLISVVHSGGLGEGMVEVGDIILSINGTNVASFSLAKTVDAIMKTTRVELEIRRHTKSVDPSLDQISHEATLSHMQRSPGPLRRPPTKHTQARDSHAAKEARAKETRVTAAVAATSHTIKEVVEVELVRGELDESYGFGLGSDEDGTKVISSVSVDGMSNGKLQVGGVIVTVNDIDVKPLTHNETVRLVTGQCLSGFLNPHPTPSVRCHSSIRG